MNDAWWSPWAMTSTLAWQVVHHGLGLAILLQALEQWAARRAFDDDGIWAWPLLRGDYARHGPVIRTVLDIVASASGVRVVIALRMLAGAVLLVSPRAGIAVTVACFSTSIVMSLRFRGRENGAADAMTNLVAATAMLVDAASLADINAEWVGLVFVATQATLSYLSAGVAKLRSPVWRNGSAPAAFAAVERYAVPSWVRTTLQIPGTSQLASHFLIAWQISFPVSLLSPTWCAASCAIGLAFHIVNFFVFGLQRFVFAWAMTYPAVWFVSVAAPH
jgi:hypothetical protein